MCGNRFFLSVSLGTDPRHPIPDCRSERGVQDTSVGVRRAERGGREERGGAGGGGLGGGVLGAEEPHERTWVFMASAGRWTRFFTELTAPIKRPSPYFSWLRRQTVEV